MAGAFDGVKLLDMGSTWRREIREKRDMQRGG